MRGLWCSHKDNKEGECDYLPCPIYQNNYDYYKKWRYCNFRHLTSEDALKAMQGCISKTEGSS